MINKMPEEIIEKASEILAKGMGMKDRKASKKLAYTILMDCISMIENLGGKVIWSENKEGDVWERRKI